jgi:hypothetical protein
MINQWLGWLELVPAEAWAPPSPGASLVKDLGLRGYGAQITAATICRPRGA